LDQRAIEGWIMGILRKATGRLRLAQAQQLVNRLGINIFRLAHLVQEYMQPGTDGCPDSERDKAHNKYPRPTAM